MDRAWRSLGIRQRARQLLPRPARLPGTMRSMRRHYPNSLINNAMTHKHITLATCNSHAGIIHERDLVNVKGERYVVLGGAIISPFTFLSTRYKRLFKFNIHLRILNCSSCSLNSFGQVRSNKVPRNRQIKLGLFDREIVIERA